MPESGIATFSEAFAAALAETETAESVENAKTSPSLDADADQHEEAGLDAIDQPASEIAEEDIFAGLVEEQTAVDGPAQVEVDLDAALYEIPGDDKPRSIRELVDGNLRHADYTRKTQELAKQREELGDASALWEALRADPIAVLTQLSEQAGLLAEGTAKGTPIKVSPFKSADDIEAEIERRVVARVQDHPSVKEASLDKAKTWLSSEFTRLETEFGYKLGEASRKAILQRASSANTDNLELVFKALLAERDLKQAKAGQGLAAVATSRPSGRANTSVAATEITSVRDAAELAYAEMGG